MSLVLKMAALILVGTAGGLLVAGVFLVWIAGALG